jgi:hypothetical protein
LNNIIINIIFLYRFNNKNKYFKKRKIENIFKMANIKKIENKTGLSVNVIIDEMKSDDIRKRINSVKNLNLIASTIGSERSRNELIPYL